MEDFLTQRHSEVAQDLPSGPFEEGASAEAEVCPTRARAGTDAGGPLGAHRLIHELFEEQAQRTPHAMAVRHEEESLTYADLNRQSNQLARYLVSRGIGPDELVGVCLHRSLRMVTALLGILKAGAAYLPLDPHYPAERLQYMVRDARPRIVLAERRLKGVLGAIEAEVIALDGEAQEIARYPSTNSPGAGVGLRAQNLVYVIYTSGSTGEPKGTAMAHRSMANLLRWHRETLGEGAGQRVLQFAALSFDVAFQEIFTTLSTGATLVLLDERIRRDARGLLELLQRQQIQRLFLPPLMLQSLAAACKAGSAPTSLQDVIVAGETLRISPEISGLFRQIPRCRLHNHYGPTETHVVTALTLAGDPQDWPTLPSIGRPIANAQIHVLDEQYRAMPLRVPGEIYIGGLGVARGYLRKPDRTAQRFIADPFSPGGRLYKTGDLGCWREDGTLEFLGRNDDQVKIRGFRIELGEIEAHLARHPHVQDVAVLAREDHPGEKRLVAYVILGSSSASGVEELRAHLKAGLPEHMVPAALVVLECFPLTPNGKLDRRALPVPQLEAYSIRPHEPPQGELEELLAGLWRELLQVNLVGRGDHFFELGGHSLLVAQMLERLDQAGWALEGYRVFESPVLADLACLLKQRASEPLEALPEGIPPACQVITPSMLSLVSLTREQIDDIVTSVPGGAANIQDIYPLAPLQEGILIHHLLNADGGDTYVLPMLLSLSSRGSLESFTQGLQRVIDRHDILRTAVLWEGLPRPVQVVYRHAALVAEELLLDTDRDPVEQLRARMRPERQRLDLRHAPLMRLQVAAGASGTWYALLQVHHLLGDHDSLEVTLTEIVAHMEARANELPEPMPYRAHVARVLGRGKTQETEAFFQKRLGDVDEPTAPFGLLDVRGDGSHIEEASEILEPALAQRIRAQARRLSVTSATLFHAAWALVVAHTSARDDVVFGSLLLGKLQGVASANRALGLFINTLPLRLKLQSATARELVEQTQQELIALMRHEQASLAVAQRCSGLSGGAPLFSTLLNYRHTTVGLEAGQTLTAGVCLLASLEWTNYPITLSVDDLRVGFGLTAQTSRPLDPVRILGYFRTALQSLMSALESAPRTPARLLSILPQSERQQLIEALNATRTEYATETLIHQLFEEQVERTPDAIAVACEDQCLTYAELNRRANQLARYVRDRGVGPDQRVGICVERSLEMVVGLLGILKAGGAYVPLDPSYPRERLLYMLRDSGPSLLLIQARMSERLPTHVSPLLFALDEQWSDVAQQETNNLDPESLGLECRHLAYVIYTSGSTGQPKGAMNEHQGVVNRLRWMQDCYQLGPQDRVLQKTPFSFDVSVWEFFWTLMTGARLVMARPEGHKDPQYLREVIDSTGITRLHFVPSMLQSFVDGARRGDCPSLRHIVCSGEELPVSLQNRCLECLPQAALSNLYGPTEAAVDVTAWECRREHENPRIPIGYPIANLRMYILDRDLQPLPLGVPGEIYIGGMGVGRGYLGRPELTAQRFVADPFDAGANARLYKTGDLGRWRTDGALEYLGRNDHQVKIRGVRIELGEIEAQLLTDEKVREAVALVRDDTGGEKRLVAYWVPRDVTSPIGSFGAEALRAHLKTVLPEHLIPSAFVRLNNLPLTPSGKLDRRSLPAPEQDAYASHRYEGPQGDVEEILAGIWQTLLHLERVGRHDNFFELGGHSLLVVQMLERLRRVGLRVEVRRIFQSASLAELARTLTPGAAKRLEIPPNLIPLGCEHITPEMLPLVELEPQDIERIGRSVPGGVSNIQDIYPLAPLQEGILFHHLLQHEGGDSYVLAVLLSVSSRERLDALTAALQRVIDRHDILRTAVLWEQLPEPVQVVHRQASLPVQVVALDADTDPIEQMKARMRPEQQRLDLRQAPLMRLQIAADSQRDRWYALLQMHHITCDHETVDAIVCEVSAHLRGSAPSLFEITPYRNHVAQCLASAREHDAEAFFRRKLGDIDEPTAPFELLNVHGNGVRVEEAHETLEPDLARRVRVQARRLSVSTATLCHAAWALVLSCTSGRHDVVFGSVLLGQLQVAGGPQRVLGMLINTLPLRLRLQRVSARELVEQTQRELVDLLTYEQASLALAQRCSGVGAGIPVFSSLLNYRHSSPASVAGWGTAQGIQLLVDQERTNYPIVISVDDLGEGLSLTAQTDPRVDPARLNSYLRQAIASLVEALEVNPLASALSLRVVPEPELRQVLESFNHTATAYPKEQLINEVFEERVKGMPDAVAVICEGRRLTYAELNARANRLTSCLLSKGLRPGDRLALLMSRGPQLLIAQLAALKSGAVYVPLDLRMPPDRQRFILQDCDARYVLTDQVDSELQRQYRAQWLICKDLSEALVAHPPENLPSQRSPSPAAYIMYTSGSTGEPKGVIVPHQAVNRLVINNGYARIRPDDCIAHCSNPAFDASTFEVWGALLNGASVLIVPEATLLEPESFARTLTRHGVTILWLTIGLLTQYEETLAGVFGQLRYLLTGGDVVDPALVRRILRRSPPQHLLNGYGPTECATFSTTHAVEDTPDETVRLPIGRPISNTRIYILTAHLQPVPLGAWGEIYVAGDGLALGYLNRPELTAERFVADPFATEPAQRVYRTGDLGRWRADGSVEYLGRNDRQVKIRGFRVELGDIEAQITRYAAVREAAVLAQEETPGNRVLVAYVVPRSEREHSTPTGAALDIGDLTAHLARVLPEYMVPGAFVLLPRLPLTSNGKLDRAALPAAAPGAYAKRPHEPPQGEIEIALAALWQELLGTTPVGREDHFFELGGHSLLVLKLLLKVNRAFGSRLTAAEVYQSPRLRELGRRLSGGGPVDALVDLSAEAVLDASIVPRKRRSSRPTRTVLLTGGTGFVGRFVLAQVLRDTNAFVWCLVRARYSHHAKARLKAILQRWDLWSDDAERRVIAIAGDLGRPQLGVDASNYERLATEVDTIYHCATSMNHLETYTMAKAANVGGTQEILRLATRGRSKRVNAISTLSVFGQPIGRTTRTVHELTSIDEERHLSSDGYSASKWVSEKLLMRAAERGVPCNIFRLGLVWADTEQGRYDELQREHRLFQSCLLSGCGIEDYRYALPPTPVDYVARAVVYLAARHEGGQGIFHISSSGSKIEGVFERCNELGMTSLELKSPAEWITEIKRLHHMGRSLPVVPLIEAAFSQEADAPDGYSLRIDTRQTRFDCARTHRVLESAGILAPELDDVLLRRYLTRLLSNDSLMSMELSNGPVPSRSHPRTASVESAAR